MRLLSQSYAGKQPISKKDRESYTEVSRFAVLRPTFLDASGECPRKPMEGHGQTSEFAKGQPRSFLPGSAARSGWQPWAYLMRGIRMVRNDSSALWRRGGRLPACLDESGG